MINVSIVLSLFIIGISLSMDTFSVCLSIGTFTIPKLKSFLLCFLVGIMHFIMPFIGYLLGEKIITFLDINVNLLLGFILIFIGIEMLLDLLKSETKTFNLNLLNTFLIAFSVSLDSFSTGLGLRAITNDIILSGIIFSLCAASFSFVGLLIGKYSNKKLGIYGNILGIILLFLIGIIHIFR